MAANPSAATDFCNKIGTERTNRAGLMMSVHNGGLNRSMQRFILEGKDGVWDGTKIS
jgi:hypothetical protein